MGKTRGHGGRRGGGRGRGRGGRGGGDDEEYEPVRLAQASTVGMMPPSDSEDDESGEEGADGTTAAAAAAAATAPSKAQAKPAGQPRNAGVMPSSDDDDDDEDEESEEESDDEPPEPAYLTAPSQPRKKKQEEEELDPEQIRKDMERLELIKQKRENDRLKRIADEGWDRFAPVTEDNKPPGSLPSDHPSNKAKE